MVLDRLDQADRYSPLHPRFAEAFRFLRSAGLAGLAHGRHDIDGDRLYVVIARKEGAPPEQAVLEVHRRYIDIQYAIEGTDTIGWRARGACRSVKKEYNEQEDYELFADEPESWATLCPGGLAIYFPEDAHAPMVGRGMLHKAVVKVAVYA